MAAVPALLEREHLIHKSSNEERSIKVHPVGQLIHKDLWETALGFLSGDTLLFEQHPGAEALWFSCGFIVVFFKDTFCNTSIHCLFCTSSQWIEGMVRRDKWKFIVTFQIVLFKMHEFPSRQILLGITYWLRQEQNVYFLISYDFYSVCCTNLKSQSKSRDKVRWRICYCNDLSCWN